MSKDYLRKNIYKCLNSLSYNINENDSIDNLLNIYQNKDGEILYANYNLKNSYKLLNEIANYIDNKLYQYQSKNIITVPFFINRSYLLLNNLGPKLHYKVEYLNISLSNIYTKITNYGLNNCLMEIYVKIIIEGNIITPVISEKETVTYDFLISSSIINGRVPQLYGSTLNVQSSIFDIPILI